MNNPSPLVSLWSNVAAMPLSTKSIEISPVLRTGPKKVIDY